MSPEQVVELTRRALEAALWLGAPLLAVATVVSLLINVVQVLTSLQESTISTVPRLAAVAIAVFFLLPWMTRRLAAYTLGLLSDFHPYLH